MSGSLRRSIVAGVWCVATLIPGSAEAGPLLDLGEEGVRVSEPEADGDGRRLGGGELGGWGRVAGHGTTADEDDGGGVGWLGCGAEGVAHDLPHLLVGVEQGPGSAVDLLLREEDRGGGALLAGLCLC